VVFISPFDFFPFSLRFFVTTAPPTVRLTMNLDPAGAPPLTRLFLNPVPLFFSLPRRQVKSACFLFQTQDARAVARSPVSHAKPSPFLPFFCGALPSAFFTLPDWFFRFPSTSFSGTFPFRFQALGFWFFCKLATPFVPIN